MAAATHLFPVHARDPSEEPRVLLSGVPWSVYVLLRDTLDTPGLRMTYLQGALEIMSPSREHEVSKKQIARLLALYGFGSLTLRREEKQRGLEPDECYSRGRDAEVPDVALEVIVSHGSIDKLEVYRGLGVREVWLFEAGRFRVVALREGDYVPVEASQVLPEVDLGRLAHYAAMRDQHAALKEYREEIRRARS
jgi:Uma2 family endonuclease